MVPRPVLQIPYPSKGPASPPPYDGKRLDIASPVEKPREKTVVPFPQSSKSSKKEEIQKVVSYTGQRKREEGFLRTLRNKLHNIFGKKERSHVSDDPQPIVLIKTGADVPAFLYPLRLQLGDDDDNAALCLALLRQRRVGKKIEVDIELQLQVPDRQGVAGRFTQVVLHVFFSKPGTKDRLEIEYQDLESPARGTELGHFIGINRATHGGAVQLSRNPAANLNFNRENTKEIGIEGKALIEADAAYDQSKVRWLLKEAHLLKRLQTGIKHHRFQHSFKTHHRTVWAHVRLFCSCVIGKRRLEESRPQTRDGYAIFELVLAEDDEHADETLSIDY